MPHVYLNKASYDALVKLGRDPNKWVNTLVDETLKLELEHKAPEKKPEGT